MSTSIQPRECSIADALGLVGERWTLQAVRELTHGVHCFDRIVRNTGASRDILTARLRKLEAAGAVRREQYNVHPPRYEYHLTPAGGELGDVLLTLMKWGDRHLNPEDPPVRWQHSCGEAARKGAHSPTGRGVLTAE
ncbi:transcriptional regulator [Streptomyces lunaelactis]|uniref:Transcriptional regulator n=1 Tax=Streptomyces lunaelactis TaxID=1535768 RepID=A0A2R4T7L4_9ACTN|nr:helix-turn-helix domain-containing protein [Streptomyces lunaelactis]AVZ75096.1 transcriptional regulator [Streptomyces lunaelactis]NUK84587.1 helix-turn-helix transcriptional regulator [Streptomyces lunaelactis]